jgi:hypothetical protein
LHKSLAGAVQALVASYASGQVFSVLWHAFAARTGELLDLKQIAEELRTSPRTGVVSEYSHHGSIFLQDCHPGKARYDRAFENRIFLSLMRAFPAR